MKEGESEGSEGQVEYFESIGRGHVFHLYKPNCDEALKLLKRVASFINNSRLSSPYKVAKIIQPGDWWSR